jgi:NAD(P)H-quinone oxidoreductase subunit N
MRQHFSLNLLAIDFSATFDYSIIKVRSTVQFAWHNSQNTLKHLKASRAVPLLTTGKSFCQDLEKHGSLGVYAPLEGGYEGRYQRRLRTKGYQSVRLLARGLGDLSSYLTAIHGVRPAHLGKKDIRIQYVLPVIQTHLDTLPKGSCGLVLWLVDGHILTGEELTYLASLPLLIPEVKVIVELGGERYFRWTKLTPELVYA